MTNPPKSRLADMLPEISQRLGWDDAAQREALEQYIAEEMALPENPWVD